MLQLLEGVRQDWWTLATALANEDDLTARIALERRLADARRAIVSVKQLIAAGGLAPPFTMAEQADTIEILPERRLEAPPPIPRSQRQPGRSATAFHHGHEPGGSPVR